MRVIVDVRAINDCTTIRLSSSAEWLRRSNAVKYRGCMGDYHKAESYQFGLVRLVRLVKLD